MKAKLPALYFLLIRLIQSLNGYFSRELIHPFKAAISQSVPTSMA